MSKPGPGSRPTLGKPTNTTPVDFQLITDKHNERLHEVPVYEFGERKFKDYPPGTGIYAPRPWPDEG